MRRQMARMSPNFGFISTTSKYCLMTGSTSFLMNEPVKIQGHCCAMVCFLMIYHQNKESPDQSFEAGPGSMTFPGALGMSDTLYYKP